MLLGRASERLEHTPILSIAAYSQKQNHAKLFFRLVTIPAMARRNTASNEKAAAQSNASKPVSKRHAKAPAVSPVAPAPEPATDLTKLAEVVNEPVAYSCEDVAKLAYSYWEQRGYSHGSSEQDWFRAEQELANRRS